MRAGILRALFLVFGLLSLALAILGIFLPLLPTTPFLLLSAAFLARSFAPLHQRLLRHPRFGPLLLDWEREGAIRPSAKRTSTLLILLTGGLTFAFAPPALWVKAAMLGVFGAVLAFIWTRLDGSIPKSDGYQ